MTTTFILEVNWSNDGSTWVDESNYVVYVNMHRGFPSDQTPEDLLAPIANVGLIDIWLNNYSGRYTPSNPSSPLVGNTRPLRRVRLLADVSGTEYPVFFGYLEWIRPDSGTDGLRLAKLRAADAISILANQRVAYPLGEGQTADQIIAELIDGVFDAEALDASAEAYDYAGDKWSTSQTPANLAVGEAAASAIGRFFVAADGTATYYDRQRMWHTSSPIALGGAASPAKLDTSLSAKTILNDARVIIHPRALIGALDVIGRVVSTPRIPPTSAGSPGVRKVRMRFRDPETGRFSGGTDLQLPLTPVTDFQLNEQPDGSGVDYTGSSFTDVYTEDETATGITVVFESMTTGALYVIGLQIRGRAVITYDPVELSAEDTGSSAEFQRRTFRRDLPLSSDDVLAESFAQYIVGFYGDPLFDVRGISFTDRDTVNGVVIWGIDLLSIVGVSDGTLFFTGDPPRCRVLSIDLEIKERTWTLRFNTERADSMDFWQLGVSELGVDTRLAV